MTNATLERSSDYKGAAVAAFAGALLSTLVLGMVLWAGPTEAQTCPPGEPDCEPPNFPPTVDADSTSVLAVRGQTATNTGSYSDRFDDGDVAIEASVGEVTKTGTSSGTWSWSLADAPLGRQRVTITATDGYGESSTTEFTLTGTLPNGKIAFASWRDDIRFKIFAMNADGTAQTNLTNTPDAYDDAPAFSPDGTKIAFYSSPGAGNYDVYVMNANGTGVIRLTNNEAFDFSPAFSPDGTKIAFVSRRDGNEEIYVMNADGSGLTNLTNDEAYDASPAFSPDGTKIAFSSARQDSNSDIYVMNADGTNPTRLTNDEAYDDAPAFSPDGTKIAFWSNRDGGGDDEIYVMSADGSGVTRLTNNLANDFDPAFSPDGTKIAFSSRRDGNEEIYVMNADGTGLTNLTNSAAAEEWAPSWGGASDVAPPETTVVSGPSSPVNSNSAEFAFSSSEPDPAFKCSLDGGPFGLCSSPKSYSNLTEGQHTFEVRATDVSGNTDPTPANRTWTVDFTAPTVTSTTPAANATRVAPGANVTATFSEAMMPSSINGTTFKLFKGTTAIGAVVSYDPATKKATLNPNANLQRGAKYKAVVSTGAKDLAGNALDQDSATTGTQPKQWVFTVRN